MDREIVRCPQKSCQLNQFVTKNGLCRRCHHELFPKPAVVEEIQLPPAQEVLIKSEHCVVHVGYALKLVRISLDLSQLDVARLMEIPRTYMTKLEMEHLSPTLSQFHKFCRVLGVSPYGVMILATAPGWSLSN